MSELPRRQTELLEYLKSYLAEYGVAPSFAEMKTALRFPGKSGAHRVVMALVERGIIKKQDGANRSIEIVGVERAPLAAHKARPGYLRRSPKTWSPQEVELASELLQDSSNDDAVFFKMLGRTKQACRDKIKRNRDFQPAHMREMFGAAPAPKIPPEVIEDRNRRLMADSERSTTSWICKDPPPGFSALDRRRA